jgi:hypothetical protein
MKNAQNKKALKSPKWQFESPIPSLMRVVDGLISYYLIDKYLLLNLCAIML